MRGGIRALDDDGVAAGVADGAGVALATAVAAGAGLAGVGEGLAVVLQPATITATRTAPMRDRWDGLVIRGC